MAHGRARDEQKERQWRHWIDQWRASGLSVRAFCARRVLATPNFYHWRRVLERAPGRGPRRAAAAGLAHGRGIPGQFRCPSDACTSASRVSTAGSIPRSSCSAEGSF
jgi:hypothetical protein